MADPSSRGIYLREASACMQSTEVRSLINLLCFVDRNDWVRSFETCGV